MKDKIIEDLKKIVYDTFKIQCDDIDENTNIYDGGLSLDSIQMIELTVGIEKFYGFEFDDDQLTEENFSTIGILAGLIEEVLAK